MNNVLLYLKQLLNNDDTIVVATSGGPDSMCLLHLLCDLKDDYNLKIIVSHVNHKLRQESEEEALFVQDFAKKNNLVYEYMEIQEYRLKNTECEARQRRYEFFSKLVEKYKAKYLMTAHHGDDLMETIMMRLTRGSSLKGYSGFLKETKIDNCMLVRPLIPVTKDEIVDYMDKNNYRYYIDKTNYSDKYTRNRFRMNVLPFLKKENSKVHLKFLSFSEEISKVSNFLDKYIKEVYESLKLKDGLSVSKLKMLDIFILEKVIEYELTLFYKNNIDVIEKKHRDKIIKLILFDKTNGVVTLPKNVLAVKDYDTFKIVYNNHVEDYSYIFNKEQRVPTGIIREIKTSDSKSNFVIRLNSKDITLPIIVRTKKNGDRMIVKNLGGTKKVKDILIDEKVSKEKRNILPIVLDSKNEVLWIPGVKKSKFDVERNGIYDIILSYEEEI